MRYLFFILISYTLASPLSEFSQKQLLLPPPPKVASSAYIIIDAETGSVIAGKHSDLRIIPGSLTKLMTSYIIFHALEQGHLRLDDQIHVSTNAWKTEGSRLFINENSHVPLETLIKGTIVASGNDASVAITEHFAGSEANFSIIMNRYADKMNLKNTHFTNSTGLPDENQYSTVEDIAILSRRIIQDFPQYFHWFHEQSITYNNITQQNRHNLLKSHPEIDGLKTGHTETAGFCLSTTAKKDNTRLIVITVNAPSTKARNQDTLALLNYGFRFFETTLLYPKNTIITSIPVYLGLLKHADVAVSTAFWATAPKGSNNHLNIDINIKEPLSAPLYKDKAIGTVSAKIDGEVISEAALFPTTDIQQCKGISYYISYVQKTFSSWI